MPAIRLVAILLALTPATLAVSQDVSVVWSNSDRLVTGQGGIAFKDLVPTSDGGVWFAFGTTQSSLGQIYVARFDGAGDVVQMITRTTGGSMGFDICTDGDDGFFMVAQADLGGFGGAQIGETDAVLARFDSAGSEQWARRVGEPGDNSVLPNTISPDGQGGIIIGGSVGGDDFAPPSLPGIGGDAFVARFDSNGQELWATRVYQYADHRETIQSVTSDGQGGFFGVGSHKYFQDDEVHGSVVKIDATGSILWYQPFAFMYAFNHDCVPDGEGGLVLTSRAETGPDFIARMDASGTIQWIQADQVSGQARFSDLAVDSDGTFVVLGRRDGFSGAHTLWSFGDDGVELSVSEMEHVPGVVFELTLDGLGSAFAASALSNELLILRLALETVGRVTCTGQPNSVGTPGVLRAVGSPWADDNALTLSADSLPGGALGIFIASLEPGFVPFLAGGQGDLCLGGAIGRLRPVQTADPAGRFHRVLDLTQIPQPMGVGFAVPGQSWYFQTWYRDQNPAATTNLTNAVEVVFQ